MTLVTLIAIPHCAAMFPTESVTAHRLATSILASCFAQAFQKTLTHPVDTLVTREQYMPAASSTIGVRDTIKGYIAACRQPAALYRGLLPTVLGSMPWAFAYMPVYELTKVTLDGMPASQYLPSIFAGVASACVRVPTSIVKSQLQLDLHSNTAACLRDILKRSGIPGLFVGFQATMLFDVTYAWVSLSAMELLRTKGAPSSIIGVVMGFVATLVTQPLHVVRLRLMTQRMEKHGPRLGRSFGYNGLFDGLSQVCRKEGFASLWLPGLAPRLLLKCVGGFLWLPAYETAKSYFETRA